MGRSERWAMFSSCIAFCTMSRSSWVYHCVHGVWVKRPVRIMSFTGKSHVLCSVCVIKDALRAISRRERDSIGCPFRLIAPLVLRLFRSMPAKRARKVDFPLPFGPIMHTNSPRFTENDTFDKIVFFP